ncbi:glycosyltransferase family 4 protein [Algoriphagus hitonicola]|uniref:UDP-N-acetylmuramyl pentapeptide phosphotransferase/UDP-N-acetylglucosamine-1-phosphate transferase n=1 Tax=Algoriphagus hitonicola TaxID=435880 RepID=A0A1I2TLN3_9BACT|nr:MraY family glycosyltransferase [Algoriphagus hitonicola]SFG64267.1 UDP-N-acetylmuramyl pentapeptide phosphotransferase/UDP-N-acetylglucosamine-1-phosphate transferase [Algoriphagus hitonicola]
MFFFLAALTAFSVGMISMPILIKILRKAKIGDNPGGRKIHTSFIPSMGGVGFFVASLVAMSIWAWQFPLPDIRYLLGAIAIMFIVGLRDDLIEMKASQKIVGQLIAVLLVVVASDIRIKDLHGFLGFHELPLWFSYSFSAFVLLALTNAFNLIDGLDGLAGTMAMLVFGFLGTWFLVQGLESYAVLSFTFLGGILAFLMFNWHPAKIFMGDTGSLLLGFTQGALIIAFMEYNATLPEDGFLQFEPVFTSGIVLMLYPLYDMARVFTRRLSQGKGPMTPDKSHVHHFLMRMGLKHNQVALMLGALQLSFILLIFVMADVSDHIALPIVSALALFLGYRLDKITVKYVKRKVHKQPRILDMKSRASRKHAQVSLDAEKLKSSKINLN